MNLVVLKVPFNSNQAISVASSKR